MKRLLSISHKSFIILTLCAIILTEMGCSSQQKGYDYGAHNKRNKSTHRYEKKRLKKADNNPLNFRCRNFKKK